MPSQIVLNAKDYIHELLGELDFNGYKFHNLNHTLDVFDRATYLAGKENVNDDFLELLQLAVLFHDSGFITKYEGNESLGVEMFGQYFNGNDNLFLDDRLKFYDFVDEYFKGDKYGKAKIDIIKQLILATVPTRKPSNHLEGLIKDADIDNLGRDDFFEKTNLLRQEMKLIKGKEFTDLERYTNVLGFIKSIEFYTSTQQKERTKKLQENIRQVEELIKKLT